MKLLFALCIVALCAGCSPSEAPEATPSAAVTLTAAKPGQLPRLIRAYGIAEAAIDQSLELSVPFEGHVQHWAVTPGSAVKRGQTLLRFALSPAAQASWQQALGARDLAHTQRDTTAHLFELQLATREQLAQADKALHDAQTTLDTLPHPQGAMLDITAPFDGKVSSVDVTQGANLAAGTRLLAVTRQSGLVIHAGIEPRQSAQVQAGEAATLTALDGSATLQGHVVRLSTSLNPASQLVDVYIAPDTPPMPGTSFRADIHAGDWSGWLLPRDAVIGEGESRHVFQVAQSKAVIVPVSVLGEDQNQVVVQGKLQAALPVVTIGATQLEDGMLVRPMSKAAAP